MTGLTRDGALFGESRMKTAFISTSLIAIAIAMAVSAVRANDSMVRVGAGGITLIKSEHVRMLEEVLEISTKMVSVKYRFRNDSDKDIKAMVAFPVPLYGWTSGLTMRDQNQKPVSTFEAFVDGRRVKTRTITRAMVRGVDVTRELHRAGLSDKQIQTFAGSHVSEDGERLIDDLTRRQRKTVEQFKEDKKSGPSWTVASTIVWKQTFPAGKEVVVEHHYAPFVGMSYTLPYQKGRPYPDSLVYPTGAAVPEGTDEACLGTATRKSIDDRIEALATGGAPMVYVTLHDVEYMLGTGRNWKGAIGAFTLRVEKDSPDQIVSLCFPWELRKTGHTSYEFTQKDFVPQDKLVVYFYDIGAEPAYQLPENGTGTQ